MVISKEEQHHNDMVRKLNLNPGIIGLEKIALSTSESFILNKDYSIYRAPDGLMFDPSTHTLYNIEYKTIKTESSYSHGKHQLRDSYLKLNSIFWKWNIRNLYIYEDFNIIEVL